MAAQPQISIAKHFDLQENESIWQIRFKMKILLVVALRRRGFSVQPFGPIKWSRQYFSPSRTFAWHNGQRFVFGFASMHCLDLIWLSKSCPIASVHRGHCWYLPFFSHSRSKCSIWIPISITWKEKFASREMTRD